MIVWAAVAAIALAFGISALATPLSQRVALRFGMVDSPGRHKAHARAVPMLGGCAIFAAVLGPSLLALSIASVWSAVGVPSWVPQSLAMHVPGLASRAPVALGIFAGAFVLHVVGIIDDRKNLGPWIKLAAQLVVSAGVVIFCEVRILTVAGPTVSIIVSILWLILITNAFNLLDNMDGLAAGVAAICAAALLAAAASIGQMFVSAWVCLILGAVAGFLPYNFPPAKIFMGDAGSLVIGFLLAVATSLTTYVQPGLAPDSPLVLYSVFVPLVLMAVPIYDTASVILLRLRDQRSLMIGDRRHFSHRLVRRGMSVRAAVLTIYLCTVATAVSASLLPRVADAAGAILVFAQTVSILLIIALLESSRAKS